MLLGVSACFSARPDGSPELPFDPDSGRLREEVWQRWLGWDPVRMVPEHAGALAGMRAIWVDGGKSDEWFLDIGAVAFRAPWPTPACNEVHFELFEGTHGRIDYRYPMSLAYLARRPVVESGPVLGGLE